MLHGAGFGKLDQMRPYKARELEGGCNITKMTTCATLGATTAGGYDIVSQRLFGGFGAAKLHA